LRPLAEQGDVEAQSELSWLYKNGQGIPHDYVEAIKWGRLAAEKGHMGAQSRLGFSYFSGDGAPQNYQEAAKWYRLAAQQGNSLAMEKLGELYYQTGDYVPHMYGLILQLLFPTQTSLRSASAPKLR
jgi:TPR repeat protein